MGSVQGSHPQVGGIPWDRVLFLQGDDATVCLGGAVPFAPGHRSRSSWMHTPDEFSQSVVRGFLIFRSPVACAESWRQAERSYLPSAPEERWILGCFALQLLSGGKLPDPRLPGRARCQGRALSGLVTSADASVVLAPAQQEQDGWPHAVPVMDWKRCCVWAGKGHCLAKLFVVTSPLAPGESMWLLFADL